MKDDNPSPRVAYWMGRPIDELTKEELIEVIEFLARDLARLQTPVAIQASALGRVEMMKRRLPQ